MELVVNSQSATSPALRLLVTGERACFRRPEFVDDLVSYDIIPPIAARRLLDAVVPLGDRKWVIRKIMILKQIDLVWQPLRTARGERRALVLQDVAYIIEAIAAPEAGQRASGNLSQLQLDSDASAHFGLSDFSARPSILDEDDHPTSAFAGSGHQDLGWMLLDYGAGRQTRYFRATIYNGVLDLDRQDAAMSAS